jgi:hypothetical protein
MKHSISAKELTLLTGILVALIVAFMLVSASSTFSAEIPNVPVPSIELSTIMNVALQKIMAFF